MAILQLIKDSYLIIGQWLINFKRSKDQIKYIDMGYYFDI